MERRLSSVHRIGFLTATFGHSSPLGIARSHLDKSALFYRGRKRLLHLGFHLSRRQGKLILWHSCEFKATALFDDMALVAPRKVEFTGLKRRICIVQQRTRITATQSRLLPRQGNRNLDRFSRFEMPRFLSSCCLAVHIYQVHCTRLEERCNARAPRGLYYCHER